MPGGQAGVGGRFHEDAGPVKGGLDWNKLSSRNRRFTYDNFDVRPHFSISTGNGAATGATGNLNQIRSGPNSYEYIILGAGQTAIVPVWDATTGKGLDVAGDPTATEGFEYSFTPNVVTSGGGRAKHGFTIGGASAEPRPFFAQLSILPSDTSGFGEGFFGFIVMQAYQTAVATYNEYAGISLVGSGASAQVRIKTRLNAGAAGNVDTTQVAADGVGFTYRVEVNPFTREAKFAIGIGLTQTQIDNPASQCAYGGTVLPTTLTGFAFTSGVIVRPAFFFLQAADIVDTLFLQNFQCGYLPQRAA